MYRYEDFSMMTVFDVAGKKIGFIKDIVIDLNVSKVVGFQISPYNLFIRSAFVLRENIISFNEAMIIKGYKKEAGLLFRRLKNMEVVDSCGNMVGMFEDIIFDDNFNIKGILISFGIVRKLLKGKKVALVKDVIVGEQNILLLENSYKFNFLSIPHKLIGVNCYEQTN